MFSIIEKALLSQYPLIILHRYIDDIFFTSNQPLNEINEMLDHANDFHPNIKLVRQIGKNVSFLDVLIENDHGTLKTSVYHKEAAEPYTVPFNSDHPHHTFRNTIDAALLRAVRYSSTLSTFQTEQRTIKLMLLYNKQSGLSDIRYLLAIHHGSSTADSTISSPPM